MMKLQIEIGEYLKAFRIKIFFSQKITTEIPISHLSLKQ